MHTESLAFEKSWLFIDNQIKNSKEEAYSWLIFYLSFLFIKPVICEWNSNLISSTTGSHNNFYPLSWEHNFNVNYFNLDLITLYSSRHDMKNWKCLAKKVWNFKEGEKSLAYLGFDYLLRLDSVSQHGRGVFYFPASFSLSISTSIWPFPVSPLEVANGLDGTRHITVWHVFVQHSTAQVCFSRARGMARHTRGLGRT